MPAAAPCFLLVVYFSSLGSPQSHRPQEGIQVAACPFRPFSCRNNPGGRGPSAVPPQLPQRQEHLQADTTG